MKKKIIDQLIGWSYSSTHIQPAIAINKIPYALENEGIRSPCDLVFSRMKKTIFLLFGLCSLLFWGCDQADRTSSGRSSYQELNEEEKHRAENAMLSFTVREGLEVTQFAAEPMMINPTNMDIDARGRVWICEARNYRLPYNPNYEARTQGDRILILEDLDQDGIADNSKVFYQGNDINAALGIAVLGEKVIVSASPNVLIFEDRDHDDVADFKDTLFTSIKGIDDDHGIHAFVFGPDGRLYFNFGNAGYQIRDKQGKPLKDKFDRIIEGNGKPYRQGMAFRCKPDGSELEVLGYNFRNIFELCLDSYGNIFQSDNDDDGNKSVRINYIVEYGNYGYQDEITGAGWRERRVGMHEEIPMRHWHQNDPGVIPNMLMTGAGSPAGITSYEGSLLPEIFHNQIIHAEPGHQVVRAYLTKKSGAGYKAGIENILESEDKWFRPSDVCIAPDGSLFISDWHDAVVGGNGMDDIERGRIYRITPIGMGNRYDVPGNLDLSSPEAAVTALTSPNQATRYLAWNALHLAGNKAEPALLKLVAGENPALSIRGYWLLAQLPNKGLDYSTNLLKHASEEFRIAGIRMLRYLHPDYLLENLSKITGDPSAQVQREIAVAITGDCSKEAIDIWLDLVNHLDYTDRWALESLFLPADHCPDAYFAAWRSATDKEKNSDKEKAMIWRSRSSGALPLLREIILDRSIERSELARYFRSFHFIESPEKNQMLADILRSYPDDTMILKYVILTVDPEYLVHQNDMRRMVSNQLQLIEGSPEWFQVIDILQLKDQAEPLWSMIVNHESQDVRKQASYTLFKLTGFDYLKTQLETLEASNYEEIVTLFANNADYKMAGFLAAELQRNDLEFSVKRRIVDALGNSGAGQQVLYETIMAGKLQDDLKLPAAVKLLNCWNAKIRNEAPKILATIPGADLGKEPDIFSISRKTGSVSNGKIIFQNYCSVCHQVNGAGIRFGPDLSEIGDKLSNRGLYQAIIYPSAGVSFGYEGVQITQNDGTIYQGYIESRNNEDIQLRIQSGQTVKIPISEIREKADMQQSLMTEGLFRALSESELVDLVTYLQTLKKEIPL